MTQEEDSDAKVTWARAVEESKVVEEAKPEAARAPKKGEWISHKTFGLCKIELIRGEILTIKMPNARRKNLRLDYLSVGPPRRDDGRVIFTVKAIKPS